MRLDWGKVFFLDYSHSTVHSPVRRCCSTCHRSLADSEVLAGEYVTYILQSDVSLGPGPGPFCYRPGTLWSRIYVYPQIVSRLGSGLSPPCPSTGPRFTKERSTTKPSHHQERVLQNFNTDQKNVIIMDIRQATVRWDIAFTPNTSSGIHPILK